MAVNNPDDYTKGQLLSADDVNTIKNNGVVQADSLDELEDAVSASYKVAYVNGAVYVANLGEWQPLASTTEIVEYEPMVGTIQMWWGGATSIDQVNLSKAGWYICDGTNGTPDLRGRVPVGADADNAALTNLGKGATAGSETHVQTLTKEQVGLWSHYHNVKPTSGSQSFLRGRVMYKTNSGHQHAIPVRSKTLKGDSSATSKWVYDNNRSSSGITDSQDDLFYSESPYNNTNLHDHVIHMESNGASVTKSLTTNTTQPSFGVHFIMYTGVKV